METISGYVSQSVIRKILTEVAKSTLNVGWAFHRLMDWTI